MTDALRPVGTRYEITCPPRLGDNTEDGGYEHIATVEVTAHVLCARWVGDEVGVMRESVRWIGSRRGRHWLELP